VSQYTWVRVHISLRITPARAVGISTTIQPSDGLVELMDAALRPKKHWPYKEKGGV
jgi:hypothetical protein